MTALVPIPAAKIRHVGRSTFNPESQRPLLSRRKYERSVSADSKPRANISDHPCRAESQTNLTSAYGVQGKYESALESLEFALTLSPRDHFIATWCSHAALSAALAGLNTDAIRWAEKCLVMNPNFPGGYRSLAVGLSREGKFEEAKQATLNLLELLPALTIADVRDRLPLLDGSASEAYLDALHLAGVSLGS